MRTSECLEALQRLEQELSIWAERIRMVETRLLMMERCRSRICSHWAIVWVSFWMAERFVNRRQWLIRRIICWAVRVEHSILMMELCLIFQVSWRMRTPERLEASQRLEQEDSIWAERIRMGDRRLLMMEYCRFRMDSEQAIVWASRWMAEQSVNRHHWMIQRIICWAVRVEHSILMMDLNLRFQASWRMRTPERLEASQRLD